MNREIKFRVWDGVDYMSKPFSLFHMQNYHTIQFTSDVTIMQYTNLKDKNGKEIYEGDVVSNKIGDHFEIAWYDGAWEAGGFRLCAELSEDQIEVIGNQFENPELLNPKSND